jgi:hypothetical protein
MKTPTEHTPTPWNIQVWEYPTAKTPHNDLQICSKDQLICSLRWADGQDNPYTIQDGEAMANARLMAAAPELLEALKSLLATAEFVTGGGDSYGFSKPLLEQSRAVIAKATT